jgi:poly-gamma-glutamate synthesis protein (capsule biosynthesis protein)
MYFATLSPAAGELVRLGMTAMQVRRLRLRRASPPDVRWLADTLSRVSAAFGAAVEAAGGGRLRLRPA